MAGNPNFQLAEASVQEILLRCARLLGQLASTKANALTVKTPEGFEFYSLYPEQYVSAGLEWVKDQETSKSGVDTEKSVLVLGIRSIGTTLSAVVQEILRRSGWNVGRATVRPLGHPFQRRLPLLQNWLSAQRAIVVDEGPGLSGSSMAAVAEALVSAGLDSRSITFFPGHSAGPGPMASLEVQNRWANTRSYFVPLCKVRWPEGTLTEGLARRSRKWARSSGPAHAWQKPPGLRSTVTGYDDHVSIEDLSAGQWRSSAYASEEDWPAVLPQWERAKYRVTLDSGQSVLWKFGGLGALSSFGLRRPVCADLRSFSTPIVWEQFRGFSAESWVEGRRFMAVDATPALARRLGRYLLESAGPVLPAPEQRANFARLLRMLRHNFKALYGRPFPERVQIKAAELQAFPSYGDGHVAPHEWVCTASGQGYKTDREGHANDHTIIGPQSILWDLAGLVTEWRLDAADIESVLEEFKAAGYAITWRLLRFFLGAYSVFRLGLLSLAKAGAQPGAEEHRLAQAWDRYYRVGAMLLETPEP